MTSIAVVIGEAVVVEAVEAAEGGDDGVNCGCGGVGNIGKISSGNSLSSSILIEDNDGSESSSRSLRSSSSMSVNKLASFSDSTWLCMSASASLVVSSTGVKVGSMDDRARISFGSSEPVSSVIMSSKIESS